MKISLIELREHRMGISSSSSINSLMLPILAVWAERSGWKAEVAFLEFVEIDYAIDCDVVALGLYTFLSSRGYEAARRFRESGKIVIIGGPHTKGCAEEAVQHADLVFDCCDEATWRSTLGDIEAGRVVANILPGRIVASPEMKEIPSFREIKRFYGNKRIPLLLSSLGCPHDCDFCTDARSTYYKRSVDDVIQDLRDLGSDFFVFCDPNFGVNRPFTTKLLERMIPLKKKYLMESSIVWLLQDDYLKLLRDSGCIGVEIGIESLTTHYKKNALSGSSSVMETTIERIERIKRYIPIVQANILFGLDNDIEESFDTAVELYRRSSIDVLVPFIATPFPGTPLYDRLKASHSIFESDWQYYNCDDLTIRLKDMTASRFYHRYIETKRRVYSPFIVARKLLQNVVRYRHPFVLAVLTVYLGHKTFNTWFHDIPRLRRSWARIDAKPEERPGSRPDSPVCIKKLGSYQ
jgi:Radical SAM superfamily